MATGLQKLSKFQIVPEVTPGTPVTTATALWRGTVQPFENQSDHIFPEENVGILSGVDRVYIPKIGSQLTQPATPMTFEQLSYILNAGVLYAAGTQDGTGTDYIRTHTFPTTTAPVLGGSGTIKTYTLQAGDNNQGEYGDYGHVTEFELSGKAGEAWMMSSKWGVRQIVKQALTSGISLPTVEECLFGKSKLYIDAVGGTLGSTQLALTWLEASLKVKTGWGFFYTGDGNLYPTAAEFHGEPEMEIMLDLTYKHNGSAVTEKDAWIAKTSRQIQILIEGGSVATPGTTYSKKTVKINLAGQYTKFNSVEYANGGGIIKCTFRARYNSTASLFASIINVNEVSALP